MQSRMGEGNLAKLAGGPRIQPDLGKTGSGLGRGPGLGPKLPAAAWSGTWPAPGSSLDLDFVNNRGFVRGVGQGGVMDAITFTRASNANYVNEQGFLTGSNNLLTFPQDFDNAAWTKQAGHTVVANQDIAPDGTLTADLIVGNNSANGVFQGVAGVSGTVLENTKSVYLKVPSGTATVRIKDPARTLGNTVCNLTTDWQRFSLTETQTATAGFQCGIWIYEIPASGILVWGAQVEVGDTATPYYPPNINQPRFDWAGTEVVVNKNKLVSTDELLTSNWEWPAGTRSLILTTSYNGSTQNIALYTPVSGSLAFNIRVGQGYFDNNQANAVSVYTRSNGANYAGLTVYGGNQAASAVVLEFATGNITIANRGGLIPVTGSAADVGNGWWRISLFVGVNGFWSAGTGFIASLTPISADMTGGTGDGIAGAYFRGIQAELGTAATDYQAIAQPTTTTPLRPTPTVSGLLIEEARTNRILWCRDATQTNWVNTDIAAAKDQVGIDGVANAASSLTATAGGGTCIQSVTLVSGARTCSVYLKRITGTGIVQVTLDGQTWSTVDLSDTEWRRIALSGTLTNPVLGIKLATSGDAVAMDYGQVEDGLFATTPILTTTATATRAAEVATLTAPNLFLKGGSPTEGTLIASGNRPPALLAPFSFGGLPTVYFTVPSVPNANHTFTVFNNLPQNIGASQISAVPQIAKQKFTVVGSFNRHEILVSADGTSAQSRLATPQAVESIPLSFFIGSRPGNQNYFNSTISRVAYLPRKITAEAAGAISGAAT